MVKRSNGTKRLFFVAVATCLVLFVGAFPGIGQASPARATAPTLGTAASFAVLAASAVTNTGATIVSGNLGVSPLNAVSGFPPGIVIGGTIHAGDAVAAQAQSDTTTAYNNLAGQPCNVNLTGQDLGGKTLTSNVYCFSSSAQLTGALTLNGQGNPSSVFIFQIGSTLTTASASSVLLINGAQACNVFWKVGSSATLGTGTSFAGTIIALASDTLTTGATIDGRALARTAAVTMDNNHVFANQCAAPSGTSTPVPTATSLPATSTAIAATSTAIAAATNTAVAGPTGTAIAAATNTAVAGPTSTAAAAATNTAVAAATNTAVAGPTSTAIAAATNTAVAGPTNTAIAAATSTAVAAATSTAAAAATPTEVSAATPTATSKPSKPLATPTATAVATPLIPRTGAGGTSLSPAPRKVASRTSSQGNSSHANGVASLPRTGGGPGGGTPMSPWGPLALLGLTAIVVGRFARRVNKR